MLTVRGDNSGTFLPANLIAITSVNLHKFSHICWRIKWCRNNTRFPNDQTSSLVATESVC